MAVSKDVKEDLRSSVHTKVARQFATRRPAEFTARGTTKISRKFENLRPPLATHMDVMTDGEIDY
jgi:hypothetical protein